VELKNFTVPVFIVKKEKLLSGNAPIQRYAVFSKKKTVALF
jgi:hypothetical protein